MAGMLAGVIVALLTVTALGIAGIASFWVGQRRRTIGVRLALGATRGDILRYFQTENFLLATFGIVLAYLRSQPVLEGDRTLRRTESPLFYIIYIMRNCAGAR